MDRLAKLRLVLEAAIDKKAEDVLALDVRSLASFADTFVLATGTSDRHVRSIVDGIDEALTRAGEPPISTEGSEEGRWALIDGNDTIIHVFQREAREAYALERLWSDAPVITHETLDAAREATS